MSFTECKYYWRDPFFTSMIMGGRVSGLPDVALRSLAAFFVGDVDACFEIKPFECVIFGKMCMGVLRIFQELCI